MRYWNLIINLKKLEMSLKVTKDGEIRKEPKRYYEHRIVWVELTTKMIAKYLKTIPSYRERIKIAKSINYTEESISKVFRNPPKKVNKVIWDAIVAFLDVKEQL